VIADSRTGGESFAQQNAQFVDGCLKVGSGQVHDPIPF